MSERNWTEEAIALVRAEREKSGAGKMFNFCVEQTAARLRLEAENAGVKILVAQQKARIATLEESAGTELMRQRDSFSDMWKRGYMEISDLEAENAALEAERDRLRQALESTSDALAVMAKAWPDESNGIYHEARAWLDKRDLYNDDLYGDRVIGLMIKTVLSNVRAALQQSSDLEPK